MQRAPASSPARVLVVDDEENIAYLVASALRLAGHDVTTAATGTDAVALAPALGPDAVVLDVMLPDLDGFEVMRRLRAGGTSAPILFLSARGETSDRVRGLTTGGEDYIVKPFAVEELVARVGLALRRAGTAASTGRLQVADLVLDEDAHRVWRGAVEAQLTATEFTLLRCLMAASGRVVTRGQILDHVWQYDFEGESAIIESFVSTLRKKVDPGPPDERPRLIHTIRGVGYTIREPGPTAHR